MRELFKKIKFSVKLMRLERFLIRRNKSLKNDYSQEYKTLGEVFDMILELWETLSSKEKEKLAILFTK